MIKWRLLGIRMGHGCHIGPGLRAAEPASVVLGKYVVIGAFVRLASETSTGQLEINDRAEIGRGSILDHAGDLTIEEDVLLSENVILYTHDHGYDPRSKPTASSLVLKKGCWIGARAIVLPCVDMIGKGAIIGAGSIVSENVLDGHIYVSGKGRQFKRKDLTSLLDF